MTAAESEMRNAKEVKLVGLTTLCSYHFPAPSLRRAEAPVITDVLRR